MTGFIPWGERHPNRAFLLINKIADGLRLGEASLRLGKDHAKGYHPCQGDRDRERKKQEDIQKKIHC